MPQLNTFIQPAFRPEVNGAKLDKTHRTWFFIKNRAPQKTIFVNAICFGPKKDRVLVNLEHATHEAHQILIFYYEDLLKRWHYVKTPTSSYFIYQKNETETLKVHTKCLYVRGCYTKAHSHMWYALGAFYCFLNTWQAKILCAPKSQCTNESKLYQLNHCLKKAAQGTPLISIGKSYVIKGQGRYEKKITKQSCIVKSLSGIRSIVVDETTHQHWDKNQLAHLPVLFQEKVKGQDLRVHVIENKTFSKLSLSKKHVDYRYDKHFFKLKTILNLPPALQAFAAKVSSLEANPLIGLDFIQTPSHYVVLEANPSPGWSAYHECNGIEIPPFIKALIEALR